mgnify:CR=1 FL=1
MSISSTISSLITKAKSKISEFLSSTSDEPKTTSSQTNLQTAPKVFEPGVITKAITSETGEVIGYEVKGGVYGEGMTISIEEAKKDIATGQLLPATSSRAPVLTTSKRTHKRRKARPSPPPLGSVDVVAITDESGKIIGFEDLTRQQSLFAPAGKIHGYFGEPAPNIIATITTRRKEAGKIFVERPELVKRKKELLNQVLEERRRIEEAIRNIESGRWSGLRLSPETAKALGLSESTRAIYGRSAVYRLKQYLENEWRRKYEEIQKMPTKVPAKKILMTLTT